MRADIMRKILNKIEQLFDSIGEDETHGFIHAKKVHQHAKIAIEELEHDNTKGEKLTSLQKDAVELAALLHDVDDIKLFNKDAKSLYECKIYKNARDILSDAIELDSEYSKEDLINLVIRMISYVSFSLNGISDYDAVRDEKIPNWMLIPRDADRLEALGTTGTARTIAYGCQINRPLFSITTPRFTNAEDVKAEAVRRFISSTKPENESVIDCFISMLIMRARMSSGLHYFTSRSESLLEPIIQTCLIFGSKGSIEVDDFLFVVKDDPAAVSLIRKHFPSPSLPS